MLDLEPHHLAGAQAAAIAEAEQETGLEAAGDGQQAPRLVLAHHQRNLLRLTEVINLGRKIQSPQRHAKQEPQPGHDAVAIADARARLGKMQLEPADILRRGGVGRPLEKRGEPLAAAHLAPLRSRTELARIHVFDHTLTQRGDSLGCHGQLLSWVRLMTLHPQDRRLPPLPSTSSLGIALRTSPTSPLSRSDLVPWPRPAVRGNAAPCLLWKEN